MMNKSHWHPAFCGATEWELKKNKKDLIFEPEHQLSKEPLRMDMLVIKKNPVAIIENEIGRIFKQHNVVEFKGSGDGLTVDDYYKVIGYACLYKGLGKHVNEIPANELTVTLMREAYPRELFKELKESGVKITEKYSGIYYLSGNTLFDTQIIVTKKLDGDKHSGLRILSRNAKEDDVRKFIKEAGQTREPDDRQNIDAVLQVSVAANGKLYDKVRRNKIMCEALRELMKDEINEEIAKASAKASAEASVKAKAEEHKANVEKLANNYLQTGAASTKKEAVKMAKAILG